MAGVHKVRRGAGVARGLRTGGLLVTVGAAVLGSAVGMPAPTALALTAGDLTQYVNPFVGTQPGAPDQGTGGGAGNTFPGADVPFGMVQWSPDTVTQQYGGYFYQDNRIRGFSLTHLSGAGCDTYEDIPFMPYAGLVTDSPATNPAKYVSTFSHDNEKATPGYYGVQLDNGAKTELTATQRTGSGRFTYPAGKSATLLVNTSGSINGTDDAQIGIGRDSISGWAASGRFCGADDRYRVYFTAQFDRPFASVGTWQGGRVTPGKTDGHGGEPPISAATQSASPQLQSQSVAPQDVRVSGQGSGGFVTFDTSDGRPVNVRLGLSFVSVDGAKGNLAAENDGRQSFDQIAAAAKKTWNDRLNEIQVAGGTDEQRRTFYSSLYHAFLQPNVFSDSDGRYTGFDGKVHTADQGHAMYTNFSGWDIYRSEIQLLSLLAPHEMSDIARSMIAYADQGGAWDRWTVANDYTGVMNGDPYHAIVSTAYAFGARDFDAGHALRSMVRGATQPTKDYVERPGLPSYLKLGYVPGAASDTLEYTSADFAIAQLAHRLGDAATYDTFAKRAQNWQNLANPLTGYLEPRHADGSFPESYDPASPRGYVEGNGAQYSWMVPYNVAGLAGAFGGNDAVNKRLDTFFTELNVGTKRPYAFLSNEPTLQTPWLYDFTGAPYKTQQTVRRVLSELYNSSPTGLQGNDDLGEMGSWYVWSAMGMYPEIPGRAELTLGTPLFTQVKIAPPTGRTITINAPNAAENTPYTVGLKVNGQQSTRPWLPESFVNSGGTLDFTVSERPNPNWGAAPADAPPSFRDGEVGLLSSVDPARLPIPPGGAGKATISVQNLSGSGASASWTVHPPAGITVTPRSGTISVPAAGRAGQQVTISVPAGTAEGNYQVPISFSVATGAAITESMVNVLVAQPGNLLAAYDNVGVSPDSNTAVANYDNAEYAYSADALAAAGVKPGGTVTAGGLSYTWPSVGTGNRDNVIAAGQTVNLPDAAAGAARLGLLGSATHGDASGTLTITYTDGSKQTATVGFTDWVRSGTGAPVMFGNLVAAKMPYLNHTSGSNQRYDTYLFATAPIMLQSGKRVASVTLPSDVPVGDFHVFAIAVG